MATSTSFIKSGAFTAFTLVNGSAVFHYVRQRRDGQQLNPVSCVVVPVIGAIICAYLLPRLDSNAITLGMSWLVLGVVVLALITLGFKASPPEMTATEKAKWSRRPRESDSLQFGPYAEGRSRREDCAGQLESGADIRANLAAIDRFAAEAAREGAVLVAFPEYVTYEKKKVGATFPQVAEPLDGPVCRELTAIARRDGIALVAGVVETSEEPGRAYNTLVAFGPDGGGLAFYRKIHLFDAQGLRGIQVRQARPVHRPGGVRAGGVRFGLMTCYDRRFPELARSLADAAAQVLLVCSSWVPGSHKTEQWRAIENSVYVAGVRQAPPPVPWVDVGAGDDGFRLGCGRTRAAVRRVLGFKHRVQHPPSPIVSAPAADR